MRTRLGFGIALAVAMFTGCGMPGADTPLTIAVERGDLRALQSLLASGADPDGADSFGLTALVRASRMGDAALVKALIAAGAHVDLKDGPPSREGWTPLMNAVHKDQLEVVRALLNAGADANGRSVGGTTVLMLAAPDAGAEIVQLLLDKGADPYPGHLGSAALTGAVANGKIGNVKALLAKAPDLRLEAGFRGRMARLLARFQGGAEVLPLLDATVVRGRS